MKAKTYTRSENVNRAAVAAGVLPEQVSITVHKDGDEVRFGWKQKPTDSGPQEPRKGTGSTQSTATMKKRPAARYGAAQREEHNGVKRPRPGGPCAAVWQYLDDHTRMTAKEIRATAEAQGWNVNNAIIEFYGRRRFNGITKRTKAA